MKNKEAIKELRENYQKLQEQMNILSEKLEEYLSFSEPECSICGGTGHTREDCIIYKAQSRQEPEVDEDIVNIRVQLGPYATYWDDPKMDAYDLLIGDKMIIERLGKYLLTTYSRESGHRYIYCPIHWESASGWKDSDTFPSFNLIKWKDYNQVATIQSNEDFQNDFAVLVEQLEAI